MNRAGLAAAMLAAALIAYFNHFQNEFHFDDFHTVTGNPSIRSLRNIPKFFTDARTFSTLPSNQSYRPIVSTTLALDYWVGGGLRPFYFHLSTFLWFLLQLVLMFFLFRRVFDQARPDSPNAQYASFAAAWYGLHPANAETINYVVQRGDLFSTLGMVAALSMWRRAPGFWYLIPLALAQLSKPPALIFPAILFTYLCLMHDLDWRVSAGRSVPALLLTVTMAILQARMTPPSFVAGAVSAYGYRITQPFVALHYFWSFFLPLWLTADTDRKPFESILDICAVAGFVFLAALIAIAVLCARRRETRPITFGLAWFLLALVPTSTFPLAEVDNDHRMFFPFVGLAMSVVWAAALKVQHTSRGRCYRGIAVTLLIVYGFGTWQRNQVWRTEATLWRDVTIKSPANGRGLMNYGLTQMSKGNYQTSLACFQRALVFTPAYPLLEVNLGLAIEGLGRADDAAQHFARAISLAPNDPQVLFYYHRWLETRASEYLNRSLLYHQTGQYWRCIGAAQEALRLKPDYAEAYNNIAAAYESMGMWEEALDAAREALKIRPDFELARNNLTWIEARQSRNKRVCHSPPC